MGNSKLTTDIEADADGEKSLHGKIVEDGEHAHGKRNPDTQIRLDGESDSLYDDGLEVGDDSEAFADTRNSNHRG